MSRNSRFNNEFKDFYSKKLNSFEYNNRICRYSDIIYAIF